MCYGGLATFGNGFITKTYFESYMFLCTVIKEDAKHGFITWPFAKAIWVVLSQLWVSLTKVTLTPFLWVFP